MTPLNEPTPALGVLRGVSERGLSDDRAIGRRWLTPGRRDALADPVAPGVTTRYCLPGYGVLYCAAVRWFHQKKPQATRS